MMWIEKTIKDDQQHEFTIAGEDTPELRTLIESIEHLVEAHGFEKAFELIDKLLEPYK